MEDYGNMIESDAIRFERLLPGPIERVWEYLTDSEKRGKWLAKGPMDNFAGGKVTFRFLHAELSPLDDTPSEKYRDMDCGHEFSGTVLTYQPPRLLSFTWGDGSEVTIELQTQEHQVLLVLTHRKLAEGKENRISVASGWHTHLNILRDIAAENTPRSFWEIHSQMELEYEIRLTTYIKSL